MNLRGAWALIRGLWLSWLQHRSFFFVLAFGAMIPPLIYLLVWSTAASDAPVAGLSRGDFVAYYLILILVNQITSSQMYWTVGVQMIQYGDLNRVLLRPLHPIFDVLASETAGKVVYLLFDVPLVILLGASLRPEIQILPRNGLAFILALALAWGLRFFWGYCLGLLAFWTTRTDALLVLQETLVFLLAGMVAPVALLPGPLQALAKALPFRYMVAFPVEVLLGQVETTELLSGFALQSAWLVAALGIYVVLWRAGLRRYTAVGG